MSRNDSKKFETWSSGLFHFSGAGDTREGESVDVRIITGSRGGSTSGFRACFKNGHTIEDTDIARLRVSCRDYLIEQRGWKWERVMDIQVSNGYNRSETSGEVSVTFDLMDRVKGTKAYFDLEHRHKSRARGMVIPWTEEREAAIREVIARLDKAYEDLQSMLGDAKTAKRVLDTALVGRLLPPGKDE